MFISSVQIIKNLMSIIRAVLIFTRPLSDKLLDVICCILYGRSKSLPHIDNKILLMSATELAKKIRKKEVSTLYCFILRKNETYIIKTLIWNFWKQSVFKNKSKFKKKKCCFIICFKSLHKRNDVIQKVIVSPNCTHTIFGILQLNIATLISTNFTTIYPVFFWLKCTRVLLNLFVYQK